MVPDSGQAATPPLAGQRDEELLPAPPGHRRIGFVGGPPSLRQARDRRLGAELLLEEIAAGDWSAPGKYQHLRFQPELVVRLSSA